VTPARAVRRLIVPLAAAAALEADAFGRFPEECCGLLLGSQVGDIAICLEARAARNVTSRNARRQFEIDPEALIAAHREARARHGLSILGYYHSHPAGPPRPSASDRAGIVADAEIWLILGVDRLSRSVRPRAWAARTRLGAPRFLEMPLEFGV